MTPYVAQIPNIPVPTSFAELWLQLGWILVIALFVIVFLLFQLARISLSSRAKKAEHDAAQAVVEAKNAGIVANLAIQAMSFRDRLDALQGELNRERDEREKERAEFREQIERRDHDSEARDRELDELKRQVGEQSKRIDTLLKTIAEKDAIILTRDNQLQVVKGELHEVRKRLEALEHAPKIDTDRLNPAALDGAPDAGDGSAAA